MIILCIFNLGRTALKHDKNMLKEKIILVNVKNP